MTMIAALAVSILAMLADYRQERRFTAALRHTRDYISHARSAAPPPLVPFSAGSCCAPPSMLSAGHAVADGYAYRKRHASTRSISVRELFDASLDSE